MITASEVLEGFRGGPAAYSDAYGLLLRCADERPEQLPTIAHLAIEEPLWSKVFVDALLSWISLSDLENVADHAIDVLANGRANNGVARSIVEHTSLQHSHTLARHLAQLWALGPDTLDFGRAWRSAEPAELQRLAEILNDPSQGERHRSAWALLLQARTMHGWQLAWRLRHVVPRERQADERAVWHAVGVDPTQGQGFRLLRLTSAYHLILPDADLAARTQPWRTRRHPTWDQPAASPHPPAAAATGGLCDIECEEGHGPLRRLLLLDPLPQDLGITSRTRLDIGYCYQCVDGWSPSFFHHDINGSPHLLKHTGNGVAEAPFEAENIRRPAVAVLARTQARWEYQDWAASNDRENLNRLGGEPTWIQDTDHPDCPSCGFAMPMLAQLDWSSLADAEGITYLLWCDSCGISAITFQQT